MRCEWVPDGDEQYVAYHDDEWGRPATTGQAVFEKICLEGFQSGLSWLTILRKRDNFRAAFADFDFNTVANYGASQVTALLDDPGIVRHRGKIEAVINNAQRAVEMESESGIVSWIWDFADVTTRRLKISEVPAKTEVSTKLSKELKKRGWKFFGPTTAYAFMQSEGLVNDHSTTCNWFDTCETERQAFMKRLGG